MIRVFSLRWEFSETIEEGIAKDIYKYFKSDYPNHKIAVWIGEEGNVLAKYGDVVV